MENGWKANPYEEAVNDQVTQHSLVRSAFLVGTLSLVPMKGALVIVSTSFFLFFEKDINSVDQHCPIDIFTGKQ